ncbi:glycosyltransferase family 90 protein [Penicillium cinerascens]|uniref:Glycosyltransferase family 90 protein n=1 Tax=Penicillium cinerascens TaxID=70096 RepID=A0A9W9T0Q6_9EURO|nr:glycosyltransferase family 90 protein [Penicillium cinerascens]KAJ5205097.1 glycosyltransferase family 90 protein [Penicillium cinerascens]
MLGQLIALTPKQVANRRILWALMLVPVLPYLANVLAIRAANSRAVVFANTHEHPVETIIQRANADFDNLLLRQSKSYAAACDEYRRRYEMEPPPGFEDWFKYANAHESKIIDDFDVMYESISPLWSLSGQQINQAMQDVQLSPENEIWTCKFSGQTGNTSCVHSWRSFDRHVSKLFKQLMGDIKGVLPDVEFLVNHLDEPRVMFPAKEDRSNYKLGIGFRTLFQTPTWASLVQYCDKKEYNETATLPKPTVNLFDLSFVQDTSSSRNICKHPEYRNMHGLFMSPTSFRLMEGMVPVLSTGSPSTMGDILFPSPAYIESKFVYSDKHDLDWSRKKNNVYWAGSTSGAFAKDSQWENYHRQRFVSLAQQLDGKEHAYLADKGGIVQCVTSSFLNSRLFDVAFTKVYQCAKKPCREQSFFYRMKAWAGKDEGLRSRLTFDLDGNGISGRWYKLVASKSVPLKQTLFREWHDDRLLPWVHFIPISLGMEELPELVMYLTSTKQGQQKAKEIADQGRKWFSQALRDVDMRIYVYRLLLELARLQDPERPVI